MSATKMRARRVHLASSAASASTAAFAAAASGAAPCINAALVKTAHAMKAMRARKLVVASAGPQQCSIGTMTCSDER